MHRIVRLFFVFYLVLEQLALIGPRAENCSSLKLNAIHSMRRGAGRGKPSGPKQLPLSLGFKCAYVWASLIRGQAWPNIADVARRLGHSVHIQVTQSPCHGPHEVITPLGFFVNKIPSVSGPYRLLFFSENATSTTANNELIAIIVISVIIVS